jgi:hypothetical protein
MGPATERARLGIHHVNVRARVRAPAAWPPPSTALERPQRVGDRGAAQQRPHAAAPVAESMTISEVRRHRRDRTTSNHVSQSSMMGTRATVSGVASWNTNTDGFLSGEGRWVMSATCRRHPQNRPAKHVSPRQHNKQSSTPCTLRQELHEHNRHTHTHCAEAGRVAEKRGAVTSMVHSCNGQVSACGIVPPGCVLLEFQRLIQPSGV